MTWHHQDWCRLCEGRLHTVLDLGLSPVANNLCTSKEQALAAPQYPLVLVRCEDCGLYQLSITVEAHELYEDYTYATPENPELRAHYRRALAWIENAVGGFNGTVEIGSNTGAFGQLFHWGYDGWVQGVDPAVVTFDPEQVKIPTIAAYFDTEVAGRIVAERGKQPNLVIARHCLAHIDDVHEVVEGVRQLLHPDGIFYFENAYWIDSMLGNQFDQIYHEHLSYLTLGAAERLMEMHGMKLISVNFSDVHGGSFMLLAAHQDSRQYADATLKMALRQEKAMLGEGLEKRFLHGARLAISNTSAGVRSEALQGNVIDAYGAAAKAVTRFAATKIDYKLVRQCIDDSPIKQGKFLPGSGIPIVPRVVDENGNGRITFSDADAVLLTAWNYEHSLRQRERAYLAAGGRFIK